MTLSIIIVNFNTQQFLSDTLESLYSHNAGAKHQVIVVDNASTPGSLDALKKKFPKVKYIFSPTNLGFGKANNLGAKKATGEYLLFLNPDTILPSGTLDDVLKTLPTLSKLGAYSPQLRFADGSIQPNGGYFPTLARIISWQVFSDIFPLSPLLIKPVHPSSSHFRSPFTPDWLMGACLFIPKVVFDQIKGFDERIFMYAEDIDICYRLKVAGFRIYFQPTPYITHLQSKASSSKFALLSEIQGIKYLAHKHLPRWQYPFIYLSLKIGSLLRLIIFGIILASKQKRDIYTQAFLHR